jgi:hypothetical protein
MRTLVPVPVMRRRMCRRVTLYWYLKLNAFEDVSNTTGLGSCHVAADAMIIDGEG